MRQAKINRQGEILQICKAPGVFREKQPVLSGGYAPGSMVYQSLDGGRFHAARTLLPLLVEEY